MTTSVSLLSRDQIAKLPEGAPEVVEYRKSGLSLNHIQSCPLDCASCIRHTFGLWDQRVPKALMSDAEAVEELITHRYFQPHVRPVQVFNRATDPFLPAVRSHTFAVLEDLDERGLTNHVLVITRHQMKLEDIDRLNRLRHIKLTLGVVLAHDRRFHEARPCLTVMAGPMREACRVLPASRLCRHQGTVDSVKAGMTACVVEVVS